MAGCGPRFSSPSRSIRTREFFPLKTLAAVGVSLQGARHWVERLVWVSANGCVGYIYVYIHSVWVVVGLSEYNLVYIYWERRCRFILSAFFFVILFFFIFYSIGSKTPVTPRSISPFYTRTHTHTHSAVLCLTFASPATSREHTTCSFSQNRVLREIENNPKRYSMRSRANSTPFISVSGSTFFLYIPRSSSNYILSTRLLHNNRERL